MVQAVMPTPQQKPQAQPDFIPADSPDFIPATDQAGFPHYQGTPQEEDWRTPLEQSAPTMHQKGESIPRAMSTAASNIGEGIYGGVMTPLLHPLKTLGSVAHMVADPSGYAAEVGPGIVKNFQDHPAEAIETGLGNLGGGAVLGEGASLLGEGAGAVVNAVPSKARAAETFQSVMRDAAQQPVSMTRSSEPLMRAFEMSQRGAQLPKVVRQLVGRTTEPGASPLTYQEARDFASNLSRMSSKDVQSLTPAMRAQVGSTSKAFNADVGDAASAAGRGEDYANAMKEYAQNAQLRKVLTRATQVGGSALGAGLAWKIAHEFLPR